MRTIEEKAKTYDEAIEKAKKLYEQGTITESLSYVFPELRESEGKRIKYEIIAFLEQAIHRGGGTPIPQEQEDKWIAWLNKQGKSSDQIHYWTEEEIEPIISDYLRGAEHYGGMIGKLRCLKPKSLEKQDEQKPAWSAEDEFKVQRICKYLNEAKKYYADITEVRDCIDWLKSLKQRIEG